MLRLSPRSGLPLGVSQAPDQADAHSITADDFPVNPA